MTSVGKWKITTYILATTTAASLWHGRGKAVETEEAAKPAVRDASYEKRIVSLARLRIPAGVAGVDEGQLLRDLKSARSLQELTLLCQQLGIFGTDRALDDLQTLSLKRPDAAGVAILAMGGIGSDAAVERLIAMAESGRSSNLYWATRGLAKTSSRRAHAELYDWAEGSRRSVKLAAIDALGGVRTDEALDVLLKQSASPDYEVRRRVLEAAADMGSDGAVALVLDMADQGNRNLRLAALRSMPRTLSSSQQDWLMDVLTANDPSCGALAAEALGRAQVRDALPLLLDAAEAGHSELRMGAIRGLASLGGDKVYEALQGLLTQARSHEAYEIGRALLDVGGEEGRTRFLAVIKKGHPARADLIGLLRDFSGPDVHALRIDIMENGTYRERELIMNQLVGSQDPKVTKAMMNIARTGANNERYTAMNYLSQSSSVEARAALLEIARGHGQSSDEALRVLGDNRPSDPEVQGVLLDALYSGVPTKVQTASWALANGGSEEARSALLDALSSDSPMLASAALSAIGQMGQGQDVMQALRSIATDSENPQLKSSALYQLASSSDPESTTLVVDAIESGDDDAGGMVAMLLQRGGEDADRAVEVALASESPQTRAALASALANQGGAEAASHLDTLLADSDPSVKSAAVYALGSLGSKEAGDRLVDLARNGEMAVRNTAISALGNSGDPRAGGIIAEVIASREPSLIQTAIYRVHNAGPEVDEALLALADDSETDMYLRRQAASTLLDRGGFAPEKLEALQALSQDNFRSNSYNDFDEVFVED